MGQVSDMDMEGFELGRPALVCRWRLAHGRLPLENRHLRALSRRHLQGESVSPQLVAWAKQHIEWTLEAGSSEYPDGVLALILDEQGRAAMAAGPYVALEDTTLAGLRRRAERAAQEACRTGVAPETLWVCQGESLLWERGEECAASGVASLVEHLAQTLGVTVREQPGLRASLAAGTLCIDEAFLASDEHGIVPAADCSGSHAHKMLGAWRTLLERTR
jgi:hypothetical protein